jgi:hypothetical protein
MHLSGEADAPDRISVGPQLAQSPPDRQGAGSPPIPGILFRPSQLRRRKGRVILGSGRNDFPALVNDQSARTAGADINSEELDIFSSTLCRRDQIRL